MKTALVIFAIASMSAAANAQDFQVGSRAKGMGGSYTAFGDDPVAIWTNPAGTAGQSSQFAITYQSFTQYEFNRVGDITGPETRGDPEQGLLDPPISPSFAGVVYQFGDADLEMAASIAYVRPFQIKYVYFFNGSSLVPPDVDLLTQTDQQFSRIRAAFAMSFKLSESSPFFKRVAVGVGLDFVYTKYKEVDQNPDPNRDTQVFEDSESGAGIGLGLLTTVFESGSFMLDAGVAYNSGVNFHFDLDKNIYPVWDWPTLYSGGLALYFFEGYPLRVTVDAQWIGWKRAVGSPDPTLGGFNNTISYSAGAEYRIQVKQATWLYPRIGMKSYDTPWESKDSLPALGLNRLQIKTKGDRLEILTAGLGLYWSRKTWQGETRLSGIDIAGEFFGETKYLMGIGFTYQFD
jgi:hypothetical protein